MYLVSAGKATILSDFADLETKFTYPHINNEATDFQFYSQQRIFVEVNKKSGLEILRIKEKSTNKIEIQRVRKLTIENVYCVACSKQSLEDMSLGLSNGQVKLYNYKNAEFSHRFKSDNFRDSVIYLDYNASDEYLSAVYESGRISIFGIKTKAKLDTIQLDGNSTLARFHPTKRFQLSVASSKGTVTIYDVQSKRKLFNSINSHGAPCRDLCMSVAKPDTLISVGYDCLINIFDTRRKSQPIKLTYSHPLSTVALSDCGTYFCTGNLKGEITTFDMRNTKSAIASKKVHESAITRLAFVPYEEQNSTNSAASFTNTSNQSINKDDHTNIERLPSDGDNINNPINTGRKSMANAHVRDSFCDFLDYPNKGVEKMSTRLPNNRDSFDLEALMRKQNSDGITSSNLTQTNTGSALSALSSINSSLTTSNNSTPEIKVSNIENVNARSRVLRDRSNTPTRQISNKFMESITEEQPFTSDNDGSPSSDKENPNTFPNMAKRFLLQQSLCNSTPNTAHDALDNYLAQTDNLNDTNKVNNKPKNVALSEKDVLMNEIRTEMSERFQRLSSDLMLHMEEVKWQSYTHSFNLYKEQIDCVEDLRDGLGILLQNDPFVREYRRLKAENALLRAQLIDANIKPLEAQDEITLPKDE